MADKRPLLTRSLTRRGFLVTVSATVSAVALAACGSTAAPSGTQAPAAAKPVIKYGHLIPRTGFLGVEGSMGAMGAELAVEEVNAAGGVLGGRKFELIPEDTVDAGTAVQKATKLLEKDKVDFTGGEISSASGLAEMEVAAKFKKLFLNTGCNSNELRQGKCSRNGFHVEGASTLFVTGTCRQIFAAKNPKKWYFVTSDYAFGHDLYKTASAFVKKNGGEDTGNEMIPTGTTDFSAYLLKIKAANPQIVFNCLAGTDLSIFTKQFKDMGMPMDLGSPDWNTVAMWGAGHASLPSAAMGTAIYYFTANVESSKAFVERFKKKYGKPPGSPAWNDFVGVKILAEAVEKTGGTDTMKLIEFLESGYEFDILKSRKGRFTKWDHQMLQPLYLVRPKKAEDVKDEYDILDIVAEVPDAGGALESIYLPEAENICKFKEL